MNNIPQNTNENADAEAVVVPNETKATDTQVCNRDALVALMRDALQKDDPNAARKELITLARKIGCDNNTWNKALKVVADPILVDYRSSDGSKREVFEKKLLALMPQQDATRHLDENEPSTAAISASVPVVEAASQENAWNAREVSELNDAVEDFVHAVTDGTGIPPQFVRESLKAVVGLQVEGRIAYPTFRTLPMRRFSIQVSDHSRAGKNEAYQRAVTDKLTAPLRAGISIIEGTNIGSGEYLVDTLDKEQRKLGKPFAQVMEEMETIDIEDVLKEANIPSQAALLRKMPGVRPSEINKAEQADRKEAIRVLMTPKNNGLPLRGLIRWDELLQMYRNPNNGIEIKLLQSYTRDHMSRGSLQNAFKEVKNVKVGFIADATKANFDLVFSGTASAGSGFLPRCVLSYGQRLDIPKWAATDESRAKAAIQRITEVLDKWNLRSDEPHEPFCPTITPAAQREEEEFLSWLATQDKKRTAELSVHFRQEILFRLIGTGSEEITPEIVESAAKWTAEQLQLRNDLWPSDHDLIIGRILERTRSLLIATPGMTKRELSRSLHINSRGNGSSEEFLRALNAGTKDGWLVPRKDGKTERYYIAEDAL